jgi:serine/threonine-protein kinase RsbW
MHATVEAQSALEAKFEIRLAPSATDANIAARCEIDLSPGSLIMPSIFLTLDIFTASILGIFSPFCLDSTRLKPLPYNQLIVTLEEVFNLTSRIESVDEAASKADDFAKKSGLGDDFISSIDLAVRESVANAVKHGNKFDESKFVEIRLSRSESEFEMSVRDFGSGFDPDDIPDPTDPANLLKASGRGILFMRAFMDEVEWVNADGGGTIVRMVKKQ